MKKIISILASVISRLSWIRITVFWEWHDVGLPSIRIYKQSNFAKHHVGVDLQILWLNIWIQLFKKHIK